MRRSPKLDGLRNKGEQSSPKVGKTPVYRCQGRFVRLPRFGPQSDAADPVPASQLQTLSARCQVAHSSGLYSRPVLVSARHAFTLEILTFVLAREGPKATPPPLGGRGRWASGMLADSDQSRDAEPAPYNAQSADPQCATAGSSVLRSATAQLRRCATSNVALDFRPGIRLYFIGFIPGYLRWIPVRTCSTATAVAAEAM
jgi:hypothetical protein